MSIAASVVSAVQDRWNQTAGEIALKTEYTVVCFLDECICLNTIMILSFHSLEL